MADKIINPFTAGVNLSTTPLAGSRAVYLVVEIPPGADGARFSLELVAGEDGGWRPMRWGLPEKARQHLNWVIA